MTKIRRNPRLASAVALLVAALTVVGLSLAVTPAAGAATKATSHAATPNGGTGGTFTPICPITQFETTLTAATVGYTKSGDPRVHIRLSQTDDAITASWWGTPGTPAGAGLRIQTAYVVIDSLAGLPSTVLVYDRTLGTFVGHMPTQDASTSAVHEIATCSVQVKA